jgi:CheY-like chemotaxis protein
MRAVFAVVPDLFFATRIAAVANATGAGLVVVGLGEALERCAAAPPALLLLDLHAPGDPPALVRALKADARTRGIPVVGFYSHVEADLRRDALAAGIDEALPRSAFVQRLPALLAGDAVPGPSGASA